MLAKFNVDNNEISITTTPAVLNKLALFSFNAARHYNSTGYEGLADEAMQYNEGIFNALDDAGFFDELKNNGASISKTSL